MRKIKSYILIIILLLFSITLFSCKKTNDVLPNIDDLNKAINNLNEISYTCKETSTITKQLDDKEIIDTRNLVFKVQNDYAHIFIDDEDSTFHEAFIEKINNIPYGYYKKNTSWMKGDECSLGELVTDLTDMGFEFTEELFSYKDGKWVGNKENLAKELEKIIDSIYSKEIIVSKFEIETLYDKVMKAEYEYQLTLYVSDKITVTTILNTKLEYSDYNTTIVEKPDGLESVNDVTRLVKAIGNLQKYGYTSKEYVSVKYVRSGSGLNVIYEDEFVNNIYHSNQTNKQLEETFRSNQQGRISYYIEFDSNKAYKKISDQEWTSESFENTDAYLRQNAYCPFEIVNGHFKNYGDEYWYAEYNEINDLFLDLIVKELQRYDIPASNKNTDYKIEALEIKVIDENVYYINFVYKAKITTDEYQYDVKIRHQFDVSSYIYSGELDVSWPNIDN